MTEQATTQVVDPQTSTDEQLRAAVQCYGQVWDPKDETCTDRCGLQERCAYYMASKELPNTAAIIGKSMDELQKMSNDEVAQYMHVKDYTVGYLKMYHRNPKLGLPVLQGDDLIPTNSGPPTVDPADDLIGKAQEALDELEDAAEEEEEVEAEVILVDTDDAEEEEGEDEGEEEPEEGGIEDLDAEAEDDPVPDVLPSVTSKKTKATKKKVAKKAATKKASKAKAAPKKAAKKAAKKVTKKPTKKVAAKKAAPTQAELLQKVAAGTATPAEQKTLAKMLANPTKAAPQTATKKAAKKKVAKKAAANGAAKTTKAAPKTAKTAKKKAKKVSSKGASKASSAPSPQKKAQTTNSTKSSPKSNGGWGPQTFAKRFEKELMRNRALQQIGRGAKIATTYKGKEYKATKLKDGWRYNGKRYPTLYAVQVEIQGGGNLYQAQEREDGTRPEGTRAMATMSVSRFWGLKKK